MSESSIILAREEFYRFLELEIELVSRRSLIFSLNGTQRLKKILWSKQVTVSEMMIVGRNLVDILSKDAVIIILYNFRST